MLAFNIRSSTYCIIDLCTSRFITHAYEWWHSRQNLVHIGRKYAIRNWKDLRACMRRQFVPTNFKRTQALKRELRKLVERGLDFIDNEPQFFRRVAKYKKRRDILLSEKRERAFQKQREQEERKKVEKEMRDKEERKVYEMLRKEKGEKERKEYEEKERVGQEEELKRKEEDIKRKEAKELFSRAVKIQHPCINLKIKIPKGLIPSLHSTLSSINSFVLVLCKNVFPPSFIISNSSKDFSKPNFDLDLPFRFQLSGPNLTFF